MTRNYLIPLAVLFLAACASPKYTYHFDEFDYNKGRSKASTETATANAAPEASVVAADPLKVHAETLVASADNSNLILPPSSVAAASETSVAEESPATSYKDMSRAERREFRKEAKALVKTYIKAKKAGDEVKAAEAAQAMDHDLKMAAIFGAVGIVALIIGGDVFWIIGGIALIIGVVFFVLWLSRQ